MPIVFLFVYTNRHLVHPGVRETPGNLINQVTVKIRPG
jgi:hypothetical protein